MNLVSKTLKEFIVTALWVAIPLSILGFVLSIYLSEHIDNLHLLDDHQMAKGVVIKTNESATENEQHQVGFDYEIVYKFIAADGREFTGTQMEDGRVPEEFSENATVEIEYFPDNPKISRIKGFGFSSFDDWLKHSWLLGFFSFAYVVCVILGVRYLMILRRKLFY